MLSPEQFQEQILPYLYDLLDAPERQAFEATLVSSGDARASLETYKEKQALLAEAVKGEFPEVTFTPPVTTAPAAAASGKQAEAARVPARRDRRPRRHRLRWAAAAAVLLVVLGGGGYLTIVGWVSQRQQLAQANERFDRANTKSLELQQQIQADQLRAQDEIRAVQEQINLLVADWNKEAALQKKVFNQKEVQLIIKSPRGLQAGGSNAIHIEMRRNRNLPGKELPSVKARVVDENSKKVVFDTVLVAKNGQSEFDLDLPRDLPVTPDRKLTLEVATTDNEGAPMEVREHLTLAAPEYVTHLVTDRPLYRPGETVRFRSLTLDRFSLTPAREELRLRFRITDPNQVEIFKLEGAAHVAVGPDDPPLQGPDGQPLRALGAGEFRIPDSMSGGQYTLHVAEASDRFPAESRKFIVHQWQAPRFNKDILFDRSSYGPGDALEFSAVGVPVEGGGPGVRQVVAAMTVTIDGQRLWSEQRNSVDGRFRYGPFTLPAMTGGNGIVAVTFNEGGNPETIVRPIPIVLGKLFVDFYPEGGDLVPGLVNRVYFQARSSSGKPADLRGRIVDQTGLVVAKVQTLTDDKEPGVNQGMGLFEFTPQAGKTYQLKIDSPAGMHGPGGAQAYWLPETKAGGVVLRLPRGVVEDTVDVQVTSAGKDRQLLVGAYCRGKLLDHVNVVAKAGQPATATLRPTLGIGGVYRITVFEKLDGKSLPMAERLVFRPATAKLNLSAVADRKEYHPGERVQLSLLAQNEKKEFSPALLLVSVVDLSVHKLANDKTARSMPTHFLLTTEVRQPEDLENADFFLGNHPRARAALDLLLGVQGWRRFAEQDPARFKKQNRDAGRILQATGPGGMQTNEPEKEVMAKVDAKFTPKFVELQKKLADKEKVEFGNPELQQQLQMEQIGSQTAQQQISQAINRLDDYERFLIRFALGAVVMTALLLGLLLMYLGMRRLSRGRSAAGFFVVGSLVLLFLFMGSLAGTFFLMGGRGFEHFEDPWGGRPAQAARMAVGMAPMAPAVPDVKIGDAGGPMLLADEALEADLMRWDDKARGKGGPQAPGLMAPPLAAEPMMGAFVPGGGDAEMAFANLGMKMAPPVNNPERRMRQQGNFKALLRQRLGRSVNVPSGTDPFVIREFAHVRGPNPVGVRSDFTETLYWHPALVLAQGKADVFFELSDASTRFQVLVYGHTADGRLGATSYEITSRLPVSIDPHVPIEVTSGDIISLPVAVANDGKEAAGATLTLQTKNLEKVPDPQRGDSDNVSLHIEGNKRTREIFAFKPAVKEGVATFRVTADFGPLGRDAVERTFKVVPEGFPFVGSQSGLLERSAEHEFTLPETWVPGTLKCQAQAFPSTLAELQKGLEALLREPHGCFEQSSTSNYPNVLILNYLREADLSKPEAEKRARQLLTSGYAKLTSFECLDPREPSKREGYEWFGQTAPPHEALTAYGLLQFRDMAKVYPVDEEMLQRTRKYLLGQRDGKGGFKRNPRAVDSFGRAPDHVTSAYIVWALTESGLEDDLTPELEALFEKAKDGADPYFTALAGISHINQNQAKRGVELLKALTKSQKDDGRLVGAATSITGSGGRDLVIETTALATLGWLKANRPEEFNPNVDKAVKWLGRQRGGYGGFGSTQSTILALKALIAHTREHKRPVEAGNLTMFVNDRDTQVAAKSFPANVQEPITLAVPDQEYLKPGPNRVRVQITGRNEFPYTLTWSYQTLKPLNAENCPIRLTAAVQKDEAKEGDTVRLTATVENKSGKGQGMTVAIIGLPGGLAFPEDFAQLKEMTALRDQGTRPGLISAWELRGRELVLYWRDLAPGAKIDLNLDLICRLPGIYRGPAPRAYLYYNADNKYWTDPLAIKIHPAE
jgi:hypothetical protein